MPLSAPMPLQRGFAFLAAIALVVGAALPLVSPQAVRASSHVWINEIHYDNDGTDTGEAVEVAGVAGTNLAGWSLVLYNGNGGMVYDTVALAGTIPDHGSGFGTLSFARSGIQNGLADGVALVAGDGSVVQFLSYEGSLTAVDGAAAGMTSQDIGVAETSATPAGDSLQLAGNGTEYGHFTWTGPIDNTLGQVNTGQAIGAVTDLPVVADCGDDLTIVEGGTGTTSVTATDGDGTVATIAIATISPSDPGTIVVGATTPASGVAGTASAELTVGGDTPVGSYTVSVTATNDEAQTGTCDLVVRVQDVLTVGEVQGQTLDSEDGRRDASPMDGQTVFVRGVVTERIRQATSSGGTNYSFFLQDSIEAADGDPLTSDGVVVFIGRFPTLLRVGGGPAFFPEVGDEIVIQAEVDEFFNLTELVRPRFVAEEVDEGNLSAMVEFADANPPDELADAHRYWERHEGMQVAVPAGAVVTGARDVFASTRDGEVWVVRGDHPLADRTDPYARRVFRDVHPLDDIGPLGSFDNGNGMRILLLSHGLKWNESSNETLIAPARVFDTVSNGVSGGVFFSFGKYGIEVTDQLELVAGVDPAENAPPVAADRDAEYSTATYNVENLYDFRDDPFDGCDFAGNAGCPGVAPPFDYVPTSEADYQAHLAALADQIVNDLHAPDILLIQEAEDQDICRANRRNLVCQATDNADGKPDTLQELAVVIMQRFGIAYDAAYDRNGADDRGIVSAFMYRTDRVELLEADAADAVLGSAPQIGYEGAPLPYNADVQNPKALNAELPGGVGLGDGCDELESGRCVFTRDPQVALFRVWRDEIGASVWVDVYAVSNHFSSGPDNRSRLEQRIEQATYNAAIVAALQAADADARVVVGGDFNVFPRPDDPFPPPNESDQLAALYELGLNDLWAVVLGQVPSAAYSYVFEGQAQTLDNQFTTDALFADLNGVRYAHVNADWPAAFDGDGSRGASDHDPQVARFANALTLDRVRDLVGALADGEPAELLANALDRLEAAVATGGRGEVQGSAGKLIAEARRLAGTGEIPQLLADVLAGEARELAE